MGISVETHTLTADLLAEEVADAEAWIEDEGAVQRLRAGFHSMKRRLSALPDGFTIERRQAGGRHRDPGMELRIVDHRYRPPRIVGMVQRRLIGTQKLTWSARSQLMDPPSAEAFAVALGIAVDDAERRGG